MKKILFVFLSFMFFTLSNAQSKLDTILSNTIPIDYQKTKNHYPTTGDYNAGDIMYVWAKSGYNLRTSPSINSSILNLIAFGESLEIIHKEVKRYTDKVVSYVDYSFSNDIATPYSITGNWVKVKTASGLTGYVTDLYLLSIEPYDKSNPEGKIINVKILNNKLLFENEVFDDGAIIYASEDYTYKHRIKSNIETANAWNTIKYEFENFTIKEAFVLLTSSWDYLDKYDVLENLPDHLIINDRNQCMISFKKVNGKVIVSYDCSC